MNPPPGPRKDTEPSRSHTLVHCGRYFFATWLQGTKLRSKFSSCFSFLFEGRERKVLIRPWRRAWTSRTRGGAGRGETLRPFLSRHWWQLCVVCSVVLAALQAMRRGAAGGALFASLVDIDRGPERGVARVPPETRPSTPVDKGYQSMEAGGGQGEPAEYLWWSSHLGRGSEHCNYRCCENHTIGATVVKQ